jgi:hypothetical protein
MDFGLCFISSIENAIMGKVHFDEDVNRSWGQAHFKRNVSHSQG